MDIKNGIVVFEKEGVDFPTRGVIIGNGAYKPGELGGKYKGATVGTSPAYGCSAQVVEVTVDEETGKVAVDAMKDAHDCGFAINRTNVEWQMRGSLSMGLGEALHGDEGEREEIGGIMSVLFTQSWDVIQDRDHEYTKFIMDAYLPEMADMGLIPVGGYYMEVGFGPRIIAVFSVNEMEEVLKTITDKKFKDLLQQLKTIVFNYRGSVLEPTGAVKRGKYTIQKGVWKFNQYYDLKPGVKKAYADFVINEHLPVMDKISFVEVTGGWNVVLGGVSEIIAEFTFKDPMDIGRLLANEEYRRITLKLRNEFAVNYMNRILRSTERFDEPRWFK